MSRLKSVRAQIAHICLLGTFFISGNVHAAAVNWITDSDGTWGSAANWSSNPSIPGPSDDVTINRPSANPIVTHNAGNDTINSLTLHDTLELTGGTLNLTNASTNNGTFNFLGGTLGGAGNLSNNAAFNWTAGVHSGAGITTNAASGTFAVLGDGNLSRTIINNGNLNWSNGNINFNNGTITNNNVISITAQNRAMFENTGTNQFNNPGTINVNPGSGFLAEFRLPFSNTGNVNVQSGTLFITRPGSGSATFAVAPPAQLTFSQDFTHNGGTVFNDTGALNFTGGTQTFNTRINFGPRTVNLQSAALTGATDLTFAGSLNWTSGTISGTGLLQIAPTATLNCLNDIFLSRTCNNNGLCQWTNGNIFFNNGALNNNTVLNANSANRALIENGGTNLLNNPGTININPGKGASSEIRMPFTNTGAVNVQSGTLFITRPMTNSSTINVTGNGFLSIGANATHDPGVSYPGSGNIQFAGGTHTFNTPYNFGPRTVYLFSSTLTGANDLTFPGRLEWFSGTVSGAGLLQMPSGSQFVMEGDLFLLRTANFAGNVLWQNGNLFLNGSTINNTGTMTAIATGNAIIDNGGSNVLNNMGAFLSDPGGGGTIELRLPVVHSGTMSAQSGLLNITRLLTSSAPIDVPASTSLAINGGSNINAGTAFTGTGDIAFNNGTNTFNTDVNFGNRVVSMGNTTLTGPGNLTFGGEFSWSSGTMSGAGQTTIAPTASSTWQFDKFLQRGFINNGTLDWLSGNVFMSSASLTNNGTMNVKANSAIIENGGANSLINNGTLRRNGPGTAELRLPVTNTGLIDVQINVLNLTRPVTQTAGELRLSGGNIIGNTTISISGGSLTGTGSIVASTLTNSAVTSPGASAGRLAIIGNFTQAPTSTLNIEVGGALATQTDQVKVTGNGAVAGTLNVTLINGYSPAANVFWAIVDGGTITGTYGTVTLPPLTGRLRWELVYHSTFVELRVILPGDTNCDGVMTQADIPSFVQALLDPQAYHVSNPSCDTDRADMNDDGNPDGLDIQPFVTILLAGG